MAVDEAAGLKHPSSIHCDELVSIAKARLTDYVGSLPSGKMREVNEALAVALDLDQPG